MMAKGIQPHFAGWMPRLIDVEEVVRSIELLRADKSPHQAEIDHYNMVRDHLVSLYQNSVDGLINDLARQAHIHLRKNQIEDEGGLTALFIILSDDFEGDFARELRETGVKAYRYAEPAMGKSEWGVLRDRAEEFGDSRAKDLINAPKEILEKLRASLARGLAGKESPQQLQRRLDEAVREAKVVEGSRIAETESTIAQGMATDAVLKAAGFTHKKWVSQRDDRVRETHQRCDAQGAIPIGKPFSNGLRYPGDPNGPLEEIINCRCVLVPEKR